MRRERNNHHKKDDEDRRKLLCDITIFIYPTTKRVIEEDEE